MPRASFAGIAARFTAVRSGTARTNIGATIWRCNNKYAGETKCATPHVTQEALEKAFVQVIQQMLSQKDRILTACREALDEAFDTMELDKAATRLQDQALGMAARVRQLVDENARVQRDQDEFKNDYEALLAEARKAQRENPDHCGAEKR